MNHNSSYTFKFGIFFAYQNDFQCLFHHVHVEKELIYFEKKIIHANANSAFQKSFLDDDVQHNSDSDDEYEDEVAITTDASEANTEHKLNPNQKELNRCQDPMIDSLLAENENKFDIAFHMNLSNSSTKACENNIKEYHINVENYSLNLSSSNSQGDQAPSQDDFVYSSCSGSPTRDSMLIKDEVLSKQKEETTISSTRSTTDTMEPLANDMIQFSQSLSEGVDVTETEGIDQSGIIHKSDGPKLISRTVVAFGKINCTVCSDNSDGIRVVSVMKCSTRIGVLYPNDIITHLNGQALIGVGVDDFVSMLQRTGERRELIIVTPTSLDQNDTDCTISNLTKAKDNLPKLEISSNAIPQRTSTFIHFSKLADLNIAKVENRVADLFSLPNHCIEPLQLVKYEAGQYFAEHHDTGILYEDYSVELPPKSLNSVPRRIITVLVYLCDVPDNAGGATIFPLLQNSKTGGKGIRVTPKRGMALIWCNINKYGIPDNRLVHAGESLKPGAVKYAMNIWVCEE